MAPGVRLPGLNLALLLTVQVTLGQVLNLSKPQSLQMADSDATYLKREL